MTYSNTLNLAKLLLNDGSHINYKDEYGNNIIYNLSNDISLYKYYLCSEVNINNTDKYDNLFLIISW